MSDALSLIRARRDEIAAAIADLKDEDKDLATAELVLSRLAGGVDAPSLASGFGSSSRTARVDDAKVRPSSQRAMVLEVLRDSADVWRTSGDLIAEVQRLWGAQVPEMSLRPLLSAMKRERVIVRDGHLIALSERVGSGARRTSERTRANAAN